VKGGELVETYYEILGAHTSAGPDELRRAYRRAVRAAHPDTGGNPERFHDVQAAWNTLSDPGRRAGYDARTGPPPQARKHADTAPQPSPTVPPTAAPATDTQPAQEPASSTSTASSGPESERSIRPRALLILAVTLAASSGVLTALILSSVGRAFGVIAAVYLVATAVALVHRLRRGAPAGEPGGGERAYSLLLRGAWILAAAFAALALLSWAMGEPPIPPMLWATCVAIFALSVRLTERLFLRSDRLVRS